jgi:hypothetical protein
VTVDNGRRVASGGDRGGIPCISSGDQYTAPMQGRLRARVPHLTPATLFRCRFGVSFSARLVRHAVVASFAARHAIIKAVFAQANIGQALAAAAILFAGALVLGGITLQAEVFLLGAGSGAHTQTLAPELWPAKMS